VFEFHAGPPGDAGDDGFFPTAEDGSLSEAIACCTADPGRAAALVQLPDGAAGPVSRRGRPRTPPP